MQDIIFRNRSAILIVLAMVSLLWLPCQAKAGVIKAELAKRLDKSSPGDEIAVIITLRDQLDLQQVKGQNRKARRVELNNALRAKAARTQGNLKRFLQQHKAGKIIPYWIFNGMAATVRAELIIDLAALPEVRSIALDRVITLGEFEPASVALPEWNIVAIRAAEVWNMGYTGSGVVVAAMDSGVDGDHPDLAPRWRGGSNSWYDPYNEYATPHDSLGHGTQIMGLMVGGGAGGTAVGVAPDARWIAVRIFDDEKKATLSAVHSGFQWLLDPDDDPATDDLPDVVNNSWGFDDADVGECVDDFRPDVQALRAAGVAVVFAAGNSGSAPATSISPANYPESFAVGAVDSALTIADFSARGPSACEGGMYPDLVAPGVDVRTTDLTFGGTIPDSYTTVTGTSYAAPLVAGGMALLLSADPELTVDRLEQALVRSAVDLGSPGSDNDSGHGLVDLAAAHAFLQPRQPAGILFYAPIITGAAARNAE
jgi:subtilisin family serine protease